MTTAAEYAALAAIEANSAQTAAVNVQNKVAIAESSANLATTHAATVGASVTGAEAANTSAALKATESENYRDLAQLWANADPNVVVEGTAYSARHQALSTIAILAAMQANLTVTATNYAADKAATDAAIAYLANRLNTGDLVFDSSDLDGDIDDLTGSVNSQLAQKLSVALYNSDTLGLADFAKSSNVSLDNKISDYLDEAGQIALQAMLAGAENTTKLSYAGVVVDPTTGNITNAAGSAVATEYGVRMASVESIMDGQGKYTVAVQQQLANSIATVQQILETSITGVINGSTSINLHSATVDGTNSIVQYVTSETDALVVVNSGTPAQRAALTGMDTNDLFIEKTTETSNDGVVIDVSNTYKYDGTAWVQIGNNANTLALADLADGKRSIFSNVSHTLPSGAVVDDLWIPMTGTNDATYIPGEVYQYSGSSWAVATKFSAEITTVNSKYSVKINAAGHIAGFGLTSTANNDVTDSGFSEFVIAADSFRVGGVQHDGTVSSTVPFRVITDGGVTGGGVCVSPTGVETGGKTQAQCTVLHPTGTWLPAGTWMKNVYLEAANISGMLTVGGTINTQLVDYTPAIEAAKSIDLLTMGTTVSVLGSTITKVASSSGGWASSAYSKQAYTSGAAASCTIASGTTNDIEFVFGLEDFPTGSSSYGLNYCIVAGKSYYGAREGSSQVTITSDNPAVGDILLVEYDGANVRYYINGVLLRTIAAAADQRLQLDTSFLYVPVGLKNVTLQPMSDISTAFADATTKANAAQAASDPSGSAATAKAAAEATAAAALLAFQNTVYYAGTTQINGANIKAGTISLLPQDVGVGTSGATGARMIVNSSSIKVYDASGTVRVKLGLL